MRLKIHTIIIIIFCCLTIVLAEEESSKNTIKISVMADIINAYPWDNRRVESAYVLDNVYEPLVRYKDGSVDVENCLATEINSSVDFKTWTLHLRKNILFHDG